MGCEVTILAIIAALVICAYAGSIIHAILPRRAPRLPASYDHDKETQPRGWLR